MCVTKKLRVGTLKCMIVLVQPETAASNSKPIFTDEYLRRNLAAWCGQSIAQWQWQSSNTQYGKTKPNQKNTRGRSFFCCLSESAQ